MSRSLTSQQVQDIQKAWEPIKANYQKHGAEFLGSYFIKHPGYMNLFGNLRHMSPDTMKKQPEFCTYAVNVMKKLGDFVDVVGDGASLKRELEDLGISHRPRGVTPTHFDRVTTVLLDYLKKVNGSAWNSQVEESWTKLLIQLVQVVSTKLD